MSDKLVYCVRGWQERVEPHREWWPAGELAARVLEFPTKRAGLLAALAGLDAAGDQHRFREILPLHATRQAWAEGRVYADLYLERAASRGTSQGVYLGFAPPLLLVTRQEERFLLTPPRAVALSAALGIARGTLRECRRCGRFFVTRRMGFVRRYCEGCAAARKPFGKALPPDSDTKARWFRRINERMYRRILRDDRQRQRPRSAGWFLRVRRPLSPEARQTYAAWRDDVVRRLLVTDDLDALEREVAPKRAPGPKPKTLSSPRRPRAR